MLLLSDLWQKIILFIKKVRTSENPQHAMLVMVVESTWIKISVTFSFQRENYEIKDLVFLSFVSCEVECIHLCIDIPEINKVIKVTVWRIYAFMLCVKLCTILCKFNGQLSIIYSPILVFFWKNVNHDLWLYMILMYYKK